jgi:hypothetical protein
MSGGRSGELMTFGESTTGKLSDFEYKGIGFGCGPWRWYKGVGEVHMNKGRVGDERGAKEMVIIQTPHRPWNTPRTSIM